MGKLIDGKQLENSTVSQSKLNLTNPDNDNDAATKSYVDNGNYLSGGTNIDISGTTINVKVTGTTLGNIPKFNSNGELVDSGIEASEEEFDLIDFVNLSEISTNSEQTIPSNYRITSIVFEEITGSSAGNISVGTSSSGTDIVNSESVGANSLVDATLGTTIFSTSSDQTIYIESDSWGSGVVNVYIRIEKFTE
jgi:hypothetical protein